MDIMKSSANMVGLATILLAIFTTTAAEDACPPPTTSGPCQLSSTSCRPEVTVENATHLLVNWENVFEGCKEEHVKEMKMILTTVGKSKVVLPSNTVNFNTKRVSIPATPCLKHTISVQIVFVGTYIVDHSVSTLESSETNYNDKDKDVKYPYSGLLEEKLAPEICLMDNGKVLVSALLKNSQQPLKNCRLTVGEVEKTSQTGNRVTVDIAFNNPKAEQSKVSLDVPNIKSCPKDTTQATAQTPCPTCSPCPPNTESNSGVGWMVLVLFLFLGLVIGVFGCFLLLKLLVVVKVRKNPNAKITIFNAFNITSCENHSVEREELPEPEPETKPTTTTTIDSEKPSTNTGSVNPTTTTNTVITTTTSYSLRPTTITGSINPITTAGSVNPTTTIDSKNTYTTNHSVNTTSTSCSVKPPTTTGPINPTTTTHSVNTTSVSISPTTITGLVNPITTATPVNPTTITDSENTLTLVNTTTTSGSVKPTTTSGSVKPTTTSCSVKPTTTSGSVNQTTTTGLVSPTLPEKSDSAQ